jgi:SAM-dependent methyltransferase
MAEAFKDHFSGVARSYRAFRPGYPPELFAWLASLVPRRDTALDCGCGNGQASLGLAEHFSTVVAVDPGAEQIRNAVPNPRVSYRVAPAEATGIPGGSVDLVVAAQALHWFDLDRFYPEVRRVAREEALFAAFTYGLLEVDERVDRVIATLYGEILRGYWPRERAHVDAKYRTLPFPFAETPAPAFSISEVWPFEQLTGYIATWSGASEYRRRTGKDPLSEIGPALAAAWGPPEERKRIAWPLTLRAGRIEREGAVAGVR